MPATRLLEIHDLLTPNTVRVDLPGSTKEEVLDGVIALLEDHPAVEDLEAVRAAILSREAVMSTGVGKGLALPHAKTPAVRESVAAFAVTREPIDFGSIDNHPVRLIFLLVGTDAAKSEHIKILSRVSRLMNREHVRERLLDVSSRDDVLQIFASSESDLLDG
ncbi:MAG: PTS sugar transporter subunit IIA [Rhodothermales bacterium]